MNLHRTFLRAARCIWSGWLLLCAPLSAQSPRLQIWTLEQGRLVYGPGASAAPLPVGSLQKPFVAKAWAEAHPATSPPRFRCGPGSNCWLPSGHGELGLTRALAVSCNAYFRHLAKDTPPATIEHALGAEGFSSLPLDPDLAIGLPGPEGALQIRPEALLEAYFRLVREPWPEGEAIRTEVLAGLREAALKGTAGGLGQRGWWAKTGTVPAADGDPTRTAGLLVAVDDTGWAILARLEPGTGRLAAAALAPALARLRPWLALRGTKDKLGASTAKPRSPQSLSAPSPMVRIRLLDLLGSKRIEVRNLGTSPIPAMGTYLGPGARSRLHAGDRLGPGLLELHDPATDLMRRFEGSLACGRNSKDGLSLIATVTRREYVSGVLAAELPHGSSERRIELGAAVLRFLAKGPRHVGADVCDSTHCAWFVGRGPRILWTSPDRAAVQQDDSVDPRNGLGDADWAAILDAAGHPGPAVWTAHCGGAPLSPHAVWGGPDTATTPCPRHGPYNAHPWARDWKAADLAKAFGAPVRSLSLEQEDGVWTLRITSDRGAWTLRYDDAHRRLAKVVGWDAMPSPADTIEAIPGGFRAHGVGWGHRVGLCLGD